MANLVANAQRLPRPREPPGSGSTPPTGVGLRVIDRGPRHPGRRRTRSSCRSNGSATAAPVSASGWRSRVGSSRPWAAPSPDETPGGGLTMVVTLPVGKYDVTQVLVVDDEPQIVRALVSTSARAATTWSPPPTVRGALRAAADTRPTSSSSTSASPTWTASTSSQAFAGGRPSRSWCSPVAATAPTRSTRSTPAPTTTSPSRSAWTSCWRGCARCCAATAPVEDEPLVDVRRRRRRSRRHAGTVRGDEVRLTPTEWHLLEVLVRNPGKLLSQRQLLPEVWGPGYETAHGNLRLYMAQLRRKLEPDPSRPRTSAPSPAWATASTPDRPSHTAANRWLSEPKTGPDGCPRNTRIRTGAQNCRPPAGSNGRGSISGLGE